MENGTIIRPISADDTEAFFRMLCLLDEETDHMMYEPGERRSKTKDLSRLKARIGEAESGTDLLLVAENGRGEIAGFLWAERGRLNRVLHTAYIVTGIRRAYRRRGIGAEFFRQLENWAVSNGIVRLELTVECRNEPAKRLYERYGFRVEGVRRKSMKVNGEYVDEYYMSRILDRENSAAKEGTA